MNFRSISSPIPSALFFQVSGGASFTMTRKSPADSELERFPIVISIDDSELALSLLMRLPEGES